MGKSYRQGLEQQDLAATRPGRIIAIIVIDIDCCCSCGNIGKSANIDGRPVQAFSRSLCGKPLPSSFCKASDALFAHPEGFAEG